MAEPISISPDQIAKALADQADDAAAAIAKLVGADSVQIEPGESTALADGETSTALAGPGAIFLFDLGEESQTTAAAILPASTGLTQSKWADASKNARELLDSLAGEVGGGICPTELKAKGLGGLWVEDISESLKQTEPGDDAAVFPIKITSGETTGSIYLVWPLASVTKLLGGKSGDAQQTLNPATSTGDAAGDATTPAPTVDPMSKLPSYVRSLLKIDVPVSVTLATKKQPLEQIVNLVPGSIIQFDKSCDEMLELCVGDHSLAKGEAVKVGDKFGLRINSILLPEERFRRVEHSR